MLRQHWLKFCAACAVSALVFAGCGGGGGDGGSGTNISTPEQAAQATAAVSTVASGGIAGLSNLITLPSVGTLPGSASQMALSLGKSRAEKVKAIQAIRARALAAPRALAATTEPVQCDSGSATFTYDYPVNGGYTESVTADHCSYTYTDPYTPEYTYTWTINGTYALSILNNGTYWSSTSTAGDGDGTAEASDYSVVLTIAGVTYNFWLDDDSASTWGDDSLASGTYSYTTKDLSSVKITTSGNAFVGHFTINGTGSGTETWSPGNYTSTDNYKGSVDFSISGTDLPDSGLVSFGLQLDADLSNTWVDSWNVDADGNRISDNYTTEAPNGTMTLRVSYPGFPSCANGTYTVATITPIKQVYNPATFADEWSEGQLQINGNTDIFYSTPDILTIKVDGNTVFTGTDSEFGSRLMQSCPLLGTI